MIDILQTRMLHWKRQITSIIFWFLFPIIGTTSFIFIADFIQEDSKIPIGMVLEDNSNDAQKLIHSLGESSFIHFEFMTDQEAQKKVESHEIDSAFVIRNGYEERIQAGKRNRLLTSYFSNFSFAYPSIREKMISYVQQDTGKTKTVQTIHQLAGTERFSREEIIDTIEEIQGRENLLQRSFSYANAQKTASEKTQKPWNPWELWALFSFLSTCMLFDWVIKERQENILSRYQFIRITEKSYFLQHLFIHFFFLLLIDIITIPIFHFIFLETITFQFICSIFLYRFFLTVVIFLLALRFKHTFSYYRFVLMITLLITVTSGVFIPLDGVRILTYMHPVALLMEQRILYFAGITFILTLLMLKWKGAYPHATSK